MAAMMVIRFGSARDIFRKYQFQWQEYCSWFSFSNYADNLICHLRLLMEPKWSVVTFENGETSSAKLMVNIQNGGSVAKEAVSMSLLIPDLQTYNSG